MTYTRYRFLLSFLLAVGVGISVCGPVYAQRSLVKGVQKAVTASSVSTRAAQQIVPAVAAWQTFSGAIDPLLPAVPSVSPELTGPSRSKVARRAWYIEQREKVSRFTALRRAVEKLGAQPPKLWPKTQEGELVVPTLDGLIINTHGDVLPQFPFPNHTIYLARGMGLTESELRHLLRNGLRVRDVTHDYSAEFKARVSAAGTMPFTSELLKGCTNNCIYLATDVERSLNFAYINAFKDGKIPVVVLVNSRWKTHEGDHTITQDIPAEDFVAVAVLIRGPFENPVWCRASLAADGESFLLVPYQ